MPINFVAQYMDVHGVGTVEMADLLKISKGYASQLKDGSKPMTPRVAKALSDLTGQPWWKFMPAHESAQ